MSYLDELMKESKEAKTVGETAKPGLEITPAAAEAGEIKIKGTKTLVKSYDSVNIYKVQGEPLLVYTVPVVKPVGPEKTLLNTIQEAATRLITVSPEEIRDPIQRRNFYFKRIKEIIEASPELGVPKSKIDFYADMTVREMIGYGILDSLTKDDNLEEIMVIGPLKPVYVFHREYDMMKTNIMFGNNEEIKNIIDRIAREVNRRVDMQTPLLDARLPDGSRVNATVPPVSLEGATLTIRKFRADPFSLVDLVKKGTINSEVAAFLWLAVDGYGVKPANILISGGTSSGKTTTLNVLTSLIPERERIITIEDTAELSLPVEHWIRFETRPPGLEGTGEIDMDTLVKNSLRMRPDRIIVGEVRHAEAFTLFTAMNTGHDGAVSSDTLIQLADGDIQRIGDIANAHFKLQDIRTEKDYEYVAPNNLYVKSINKSTLKTEDKKVTRIWRKRNHQAPIEIKTKSGKKIKVTSDHPVYKIDDGIVEINAENLKNGDYIALPRDFTITSDEDVADTHLVGLILGDGHIDQNQIQFTNKEPALIQKFSDDVLKYSANKITSLTRDNVMVAEIWDKNLSVLINSKFDVPFGNKTKIFNMPENILKAGNVSVAELIKGLFDCDSHVNLITNCIEFSTSNKNVVDVLPLMLLRFGIVSRTSMQKTDGKGNIGPYYKVTIYGRENLDKFSKSIGFYHPQKMLKLGRLLEKSGDNYDLIPNMSNILKKAREENGLTQEELAKRIGRSTRSIIEAYETGARNVSRNVLKEICSVLEGEMTKQLLFLSDSEIFWDKVVSVKRVKSTDYIYDFTVEDNHTYIANGFFVSNCMGTVHANSAEETVTRLLNPPMDVPPLMLGALDFVVVEQKLHDRRKGTIRRITEVAEFEGFSDEKPQLQVLYQWDAVNDTIKRTGVPSRYLRELMRFTGLSREDLEKEILKRKAFIEDLYKRDIVGLSGVTEAIRSFRES